MAYWSTRKRDVRVALRGLKVRREEIGARLEEVRGRLSQAAFADELGVALKTIGRYESGERLPDAEFLLLLWEKRGVSSHWVLTGLGPGRPPASSIQDVAGAYSIADGFVRIPLYPDVVASAGSGELVQPADEESVELRSFSLAWIRRELRVNPADLVLMHVEGDSMDNGREGLKPGDVAIVNRVDTAATKDGVYVLRLGDALLVKRLQRLPGDRLKVISDNPAYAPFEVDSKALQEGFSIIGRVVYAWGGRRF